MSRGRAAVGTVTGAAVILGSVLLAGPALAAGLGAPAAPEVAHVAAPGDSGPGDELFQWDPVAGASGYSLEISTSPTFAAGADVVPVVKTLLPSWVPTSPLGGVEDRQLWWRVAAVSGSATGTWTDAQALWEDHLAAPVPAGPGSGPDDAEIQYPDPVAFSWAPVPGAVSYDVQWAPVSDADFSSASDVTTQSTTATTLTPTTLLARTLDGEPIAWHWRVRAQLFAGTGLKTAGPWSSDERDFTVTWPDDVSKPHLIEPAPSTGALPSDPVVTDPLFRWSPVAGASAYTITLGKSESDDRTSVTDVVKTATVTTTSYVLPDPLLDQQYFWQVVPLDSAKQPGTPSDVQEFIKRWGAQTAPTTTNDFATGYPQPLVGTSDAAAGEAIPLDRFELSWEPLPRATYYEVEASATDGSSTLTCQTASTSVTIFTSEASGTGTPSALRQQAASCLWGSTTSKRIQVGVTYRWRVRGVQLASSSTAAITSAAPTGTVRSAWSDPQAGDTSRSRYVTVTAATTGDVGQPSLDDSSTHQAVPGEPAPLMTWAPVGGAAFYVVEVGLNAEVDTNQIATFRVPGTSLRATGVFADNQVSLPYYWRIRAAVSDIGTSAITYLGDWSNSVSWSKDSSATSFAVDAPVTQSDGSTLLRWAPQAESAPGDGGSRGYLVTIHPSANANAVVGTPQKATYPFYVAANATSATSSKTLAPGAYIATVQPLDATGTAGRPSGAQPFVVDGSAPTGLLATRAGSGETLSWASSPGALSYKVSLTTGTTTRTFTTAQTSVTVPDVAPGAYTWSVVPTDYTAVAGGTATGSFTIAPQTVVPRATGTTAISWHNPALDWAPLAGASRYLVKIVNSTSGATVESAETVATSYVPAKALAYGTPYSWQVSAVPELATTSTTRAVLGASVQVQATFSTAPGTPARPTLTLSAGTTVTAKWTALTGAAVGSTQAPRYAVRYGVVNPTTGTPDAWLPSSPKAVDALSYAVSGLTKGATYAFQVRSSNDLGTSAWSTQATVATGTVPGAPQSVTAKATVGGLSLRWGAPKLSTGSPAVTKYTVKYAIGSAAAKSVTTTTTSVTLSGLTARSKYTVSITATNSLGTGSAAVVGATPYGAASAPTSAKVTRGDRSAVVTWAKPSSDGGSAVTGYVVQLSTYNATSKKWSAWATRTTVGATIHKATLTSLTNGTKYHVRIYAKTAPAPTGAASGTLSVTPAGKPATPTSLKVAVSKGKAKVTWKKPSANGSAVTGYVLQYSTNGKTWKTKTSPKASAKSYTWSKPGKGKTLYVRIYAKNAVGSGPKSAKVKFVGK